jgi:hypothetical protein
MRSSEAMNACRRLCSITPLRASIRTSARFAVEAPVTMLRVYCTWPGGVGDDELALGRGEVAVGHVDGDALLALGAQAVGEQREVLRVAAWRLGASSSASSWSSKIDLESYSRRPMSVDLPSSTLPRSVKRSRSMSR